MIMSHADNIGFGDLRLVQGKDSFRYGIDAVILADFAVSCSSNAARIIDLGTGNAIIPLILSHKIRGSHITGIEVQKEQALLAEENVRLNGLDERITIIRSDILDIDPNEMQRFDIVTCNPPYVKKGAGIQSVNTAKMTARHETTAVLKDFLEISEMLIKDDGTIVFVHRPSRLTELFISARECGLSPVAVRMVCPYPGSNANIVLVKLKKGKNKDLLVLPELHVRSADGAYTQEIEKIYGRNEKNG